MSVEVTTKITMEVATEILAKVTSRLKIFNKTQELPNKL